MRSSRIAALCVLALLAAGAMAQAPEKKAGAKAAAPAKQAAPAAMPMPKPGPELKRLAYFAGIWSTQGTMQPSDFGPGGKWSGTDHNEWFPGGFFLLSHSDANMGAMGKMKEMATFGYDTNKKVYTYHAVNSMGEEENSTGTVNGSDWTWTMDSMMNGKSMKARFLVHEEPPTAYTMKFDLSSDGGKTWKTVMDGKSTKTAAKAGS